ncbi:hypothetical protein [Actinomycetospora chiangmaiensis]|uniref:hypothetical protein n=1 Tax=Actinomycetospora chiangmaiensis TaxID=402650 RepID=UPI0003732018|nr:hypothetical protein [Actinomycetospora chiangmaiensis]
MLAVVIFVGVFFRIRQRWFMPGFPAAGYTEWVVRSTVEGTAIAPNQYRPLMPWVMALLADVGRVPLPTAILAADAALLAVALILLYRLSMRLGASWLMLAAAAGWAWFAVKLDHWHPEIMLLTCIVLAVTLLLSGPCPPALHLTALGLLTCGARTDYAAGLGLVVLVVGMVRRRRLLIDAGVLIGIVALGMTVVLAEVLYPQARYQVDVVQVPFNVTPGSLVFVLTFYGPLLVAPALLAVRRRAFPPLAVVIGWFLVEFAATFVIGRPEESRLFMPLVPACAVAAAVAWRELRRDVDAERMSSHRNGGGAASGQAVDHCP